MSIIIDDNTPLVQYSPPSGWSRAGRAPEFDATTHASATPGDTATLAFDGTSISVYGTVAPSAGSRLNFSIDGVDLGSYEAPLGPVAVQNQLFWTSPVFNETTHQLVVTVAKDASLAGVNALNETFFLDYFVITPTAAAVQSVLLFDDNDSRVTYSPGGWQSGNSVECLESTQHVSTSAESWAALPFNGTGISLVGTPSQRNFKASIVIDESQPIISQSQDHNQQLFNTSGLTPGPHTINVTVLEGNLGIDYFMVTNDGPASNNSNAQAQASPPQPSVSPLSDAGALQTSKTLPIAAIVGSVVGGLVFLLLLLVAVLLLRRRSAGRRNQAAFDYPVTSEYPVMSQPHPWANKRGSVTSMTTLTEGDDREPEYPKNFSKERPASRYIYYE
ncbi:hypothetical protein K438DRAFT_1870134 [Mycena galopus ATCC 62051]|nr:hypothetical protein K438DRAFT_1870134 [Mycena galopus ATCC 62051]